MSIMALNIESVKTYLSPKNIIVLLTYEYFCITNHDLLSMLKGQESIITTWNEINVFYTFQMMTMDLYTLNQKNPIQETGSF